jgi:hypothetical protein
VTAPHGSKPGASGTTLVYRPTPCVRFMHRNETSSKQFLSCMARLEMRKHFYPQPYAVEPTETLFCCVRAKELANYSYGGGKKWQSTLPPYPPFKDSLLSLRLKAEGFTLDR